MRVTGTETFLVYDIPATLRGVVNNVIGNVPEPGAAAGFMTLLSLLGWRWRGEQFKPSLPS